MLVVVLASFIFSVEVQSLRDKLPPTNDRALRTIYKKPLIFYTEKEMPRAYQYKEGVFDAFTNISALAPGSGRTDKPVELFGNPNREFPWGHPAGTHRSTNVDKFGFVYLPAPIRYWSEDMWKSSSPNVDFVKRWRYPEGTVFGEVLLNKGYAFDLRTRTKTKNKWTTNAYRPVLTREEYEDLLGETAGYKNVSIKRLRSNHPGHTSFDERAALDNLGPIPAIDVVYLLSRPFRSAKGVSWITHKGVAGYAPTTEADFHIVPKNYDGGFISIDDKSCARCHNDVKKDSGFFDTPRDWYGRVRGDDGIFSFHPFAIESIKQLSEGNESAEWSEQLIKAKLLQHWDDK